MNGGKRLRADKVVRSCKLGVKRIRKERRDSLTLGLIGTRQQRILRKILRQAIEKAWKAGEIQALKLIKKEDRFHHRACSTTAEQAR